MNSDREAFDFRRAGVFNTGVMNSDSSVLALLLIGGAAAFAATLYGLAALWAVGGRRGWLVRWAPVTLLLAALAPIGAYELLALYAVQVAMVIGALLLAGFVKRRRAAPSGRVPLFVAPRFSLRDVLKAVLLTAAVLAIIRVAAPDTNAAPGSMERWPWAVAGVVLGAVTLVATWIVFGQGRWSVRVITVVLLAASSGVTPIGLRNVVYVYNLVSVVEVPARAFLFSPGFDGLPLLICLALICRSRWAFWRRDIRADGELLPRADNSSAAQSRWRWPARAGILTFAAFGGWLLGSMYWALLPPAKPKLEPLPDPNGYNELLGVAAALNWTSVPGQDFDEVPLAASQAFVQANAAPLALVRQALLMPCRCPVDFDEAFISRSLPQVQAVRTLARALRIEAKVVAAEGRSSDAVQRYADIVRLGRQFFRGGLVIHELVADAIEGVGLAGLVEELGTLDPSGLVALRKSLEATADERESLDTILARDRLWDMVSGGWQGRLERWCNYLAGANEYRGTLLGFRARGAADLRLILAEAAIRRYAMAEGAPPESLALLVPDYLSAVPLDPFGDGPLVYRRTADGYLLYSVGANGTDDGGQRVSRYEATTLRKGDLFFDASSDMPGDNAIPQPGDDD